MGWVAIPKVATLPAKHLRLSEPAASIPRQSSLKRWGTSLDVELGEVCKRLQRAMQPPPLQAAKRVPEVGPGVGVRRRSCDRYHPPGLGTITAVAGSLPSLWLRWRWKRCRMWIRKVVIKLGRTWRVARIPRPPEGAFCLMRTLVKQWRLRDCAVMGRPVLDRTRDRAKDLPVQQTLQLNQQQRTLRFLIPALLNRRNEEMVMRGA
mmetsp:Transcript_58794/g.155661  ORF Transcript_58794/g.155661 Transcript_58794/m.155661 type:complete len:206 (+) Transcript_58794:1095-1712(+)